MRLAWFSPWPPDPSGIAGRSAELVPILSNRGHGVDIFVDERRVTDVCRASSAPPGRGEMRVQSAHDFVWRARRRQYDLAVYQVGNSRLHEYMWPYLWHAPGLAVLHDVRLHHARGRALLSGRRANAYREEFAWAEPHAQPEAAELAIAGFSGAYYYLWPMTRAVIEHSRLVGVHAHGALGELIDRYPDRPFVHIALGEGSPVPVSDDRRLARRRQLGIAPDAVVFGVFGGLSEEKRIEPILHAFAAARPAAPATHLLLAGDADPSLRLPELIRSLGLIESVSITGRLDDQAFDEAVAVADVSLHLRWPSSVEVSGPWLRALAAGRPTVITDLPHLSDVPSLDPRSWRPHAPAPRETPPRAPVTVSVDILDEAHSLRLAMRRLASDTALRTTLGRAAREYWETHHTIDRMADDYERAMARAVSLPSPAPTGPAHLHPDPTAHARSLTAAFDVADPLSS